MVFPPIHWFMGIQGAGGIISDIMFLAKKEFDGKLKTAEGTLSVAGDLATLTASSGKDMYLAKAYVSATTENADTAAEVSVTIELKVNGVIKGTWRAQITDRKLTNESRASSSVNYQFAMTGIKVAATQIIKLEVIQVGALIEANGELVCFEETTGETPVI